MARRSSHSPEELRELILRAAETILEKDGIGGLSARAIASKVGYSPGTLYNIFANLDEIVLHVAGRLLDALDERLASVEMRDEPKHNVRQLAQAYLAFTTERPKLWNVLVHHQIPGAARTPPWFREKIARVLARFEDIIGPLCIGHDNGQRQRSAQLLLASLHGLASLATLERLALFTPEPDHIVIDAMVTSYIAGLSVAEPKRRRARSL